MNISDWGKPNTAQRDLLVFAVSEKLKKHGINPSEGDRSKMREDDGEILERTKQLLEIWNG